VAVAVGLGCRSGAGREQEPGVEILRDRMIQQQIQRRGVTNVRVLDALRRVPRHEFVPDSQRPNAYQDSPLPIGYGQTISQPYIVAYMTEVLDPQPTDRVLEIGTGSGYQAAVLAELAGEVYSIEVVDALAATARDTLMRLGYRNVHVRSGDGYQGWPDAAPFQKIIVTAAPPTLPGALVDQLAVGGTLVAPVGAQGDVQMMTVVRRTAEGVVIERTLAVQFVPMVEP
jgi:protein-L-isoaspartate(D-aspartate) O-methyltransferase